jgi:hypothetical protein
VILAGAAWSGTSTEVEYGYTGSKTARTHRYIGSVSPWLGGKGKRRKVTVPCYSLADALAYTDGLGFAWVKSDCEGCEHVFLKGPRLAELGTIEGEWHHRDGTPAEFAAQLSATHDVTWSEGIGGGPFLAVRRG